MMIDKFVSDLEKADRMFLGQVPPETLAKMANVRPIKVNARMKRFVSEKRWKAGYDFLESIHQEIFESMPSYEQEAITKELKALERGVTVEELDAQPERPELTPEYLKSIGREDLLDWGSE
jgi:hypothetical protein